MLGAGNAPTPVVSPFTAGQEQIAFYMPSDRSAASRGSESGRVDCFVIDSLQLGHEHPVRGPDVRQRPIEHLL